LSAVGARGGMCDDRAVEAAGLVGMPLPVPGMPAGSNLPAREAAARVLGELTDARARATQAEEKLERAFAENVRLVELLSRRTVQSQEARGTAVGAEEDLRRERELTAHLRGALAESKAEVLRVAQRCAERLADTVEALREKERECGQLSAEVEELRTADARHRRLEREAAAARSAARVAEDSALAAKMEAAEAAAALGRERTLVRQLQAQLAEARGYLSGQFSNRSLS